MFSVCTPIMSDVEHPFVAQSTPCCLESLSKLVACLVIIWLQELFICSDYGFLNKYVICKCSLMSCGRHCLDDCLPLEPFNLPSEEEGARHMAAPVSSPALAQHTSVMNFFFL